MEDALGAIRLLVPCDYDSRINISEELSIRFTDVGHLLGSSSIEVFAKEGKEERIVVFSGDLGNSNKPILRDPVLTRAADYVVMESTYGDRIHGESTPDYAGDLAKIIAETFQRGGNVVIPCFAVGRTQEMLYFLRQIKEEKLVTRGINPIGFPGLKLSITSDDSKAINFDNRPKVILSSSGMCEAGRTLYLTAAKP